MQTVNVWASGQRARKRQSQSDAGVRGRRNELKISDTLVSVAAADIHQCHCVGYVVGVVARACREGLFLNLDICVFRVGRHQRTREGALGGGDAPSLSYGLIGRRSFTGAGVDRLTELHPRTGSQPYVEGLGLRQI